VADLEPVTLESGQKLRVVATTTIIGDLVRQVGGDMIDLRVMMPLGADTHSFNPTPQDAAAITEADVVFINGLHLEEFLGELIDNAGGQAVVVAVSAGVETRQSTELHEAENGEDTAESQDPHVWLNPINAQVMIHNIEVALSALDPANAKTYQAKAERYQSQLTELDDWVMAEIESIPAGNRKLVTDHDAFGYYADRYGLEIVGAVIPAYGAGAEPSAQELAALEDTIRRLEVKAIFVGTTVNPALAERMVQDLGIKLVPLYTESLGGPDSGAESYLDYFRYNTNAITTALK
jgi:ABC-type Zn uptake system ZnuABC Zn-binding protein ZnuA